MDGCFESVSQVRAMANPDDDTDDYDWGIDDDAVDRRRVRKIVALVLLAVIALGSLCMLKAARGDDFRDVLRKPTETVKPFRAIMWSPSWCGVCTNNHNSLTLGKATKAATGEGWYGVTCEMPLVVYQIRKGYPLAGDEALFPADVRKRAENHGGWPVWHIETPHRPTGWCFANGAKTLDELVAIHKEPK